MDWQTFAQLVIAAVAVMLVAFLGVRLVLIWALGDIDRRLDDLEARVAALEGEPEPEPPRDPTMQPFTSASWWNSPLCSGATYTTTSDPRTAQVRGFGAGKINSTDWSYPVFVGTSAHPLRRVTEFDNYGEPTGDVADVYVPDNAKPCGPNSTDKPVLVINGSTDFEMYKFARDGDGIRTTRLERVDITGDGSGTGAIASSTPAIGGLIRPEELAAGRIPHVLKMSAPDELLKDGEVWPARSQDGNAETAYTGDIPMGTKFALMPDVDIDALGLSKEGRAIAEALRDYGAYILVRASTVCVFVEGSHVDTEAVARADADYRRLIGMLVAVDGQNAEHPGGPGTPRVPAVPPLAA